MSTTSFKRADLLVTNVATSMYGPVSAGTTAIAFHGTASNIDNTNKVSHSITIEIRNGAAVTNRLNVVTVPYGSAAKVPKMVLVAGDSIYAVSDLNNVIELSIEILEIIG